MGATLALALSRSGIRCILIEQRRGLSAEHRPVALSYSSRQILDALDVWSRVAPLASPIARVHVSQRSRFGATRLCGSDFGLEALGYVIDVRTLVGIFDEILDESAGVCRLSSTAVTGLERSERGVRLQLRGSTAETGTRSLDADAVVAADGGQTSWCAAHVETLESREYRHSALGALVRGERDHHGVAYERFTGEGPIALLPMRGKSCALVWTLAPECAMSLKHAPEAVFLRALHRAFGDRLGRFVGVRNREVFPLRRTRSRSPSNARILLAGSAANTLHPVAGQGLNLGLRDAAAAAEVFADAVRGGADPGAPECIERYRALRRRDHDKVRLATDLLARAFLPQFGPLALLRGAALVGLDLVDPAKREFARHAMGLGFPVSRLARGLSP